MSIQSIKQEIKELERWTLSTKKNRKQTKDVVRKVAIISITLFVLISYFLGTMTIPGHSTLEQFGIALVVAAFDVFGSVSCFCVATYLFLKKLKEEQVRLQQEGFRKSENKTEAIQDLELLPIVQIN